MMLRNAFLLAATATFLGACGGTTFQTGGSDDGLNDGGSGDTTGSGGESGASTGSGGAAGGNAGGGPSTGGSTTGGRGGSPNGGQGGGISSGGTSSGGVGGGTNVGGSGSDAGTELYAHWYDQSCYWNSDCTLVTEGDACGCPTCYGSAVSTSAADEYLADWSSISCPPDQAICGTPCRPTLPACYAGVCAARMPVHIEGTNYDRTCSEDSDCAMILLGEVCSTCRCAAAAVSPVGYEQYQADVNGVDCGQEGPAVAVCDCAFPGTPLCNREGDGAVGECIISQ